MATTGKSRGGDKAAEGGVPLDQVLGALEEKLDGLVGRVRDLVGENARLKAGAMEAAAERDRLQKELEDLREVAARQSEASEKLTRYEAERDELRARVERLLSRLEEAAEAPPEA